MRKTAVSLWILLALGLHAALGQQKTILKEEKIKTYLDKEKPKDPNNPNATPTPTPTNTAGNPSAETNAPAAPKKGPPRIVYWNER